MATPTELALRFRERLKRREPLLGTFVKSVSYQAVEALGDCGLDFVVIDAEHAPYTRADLDRALLAAAAVGLPALVRVPVASDEHIGNALDGAAAGVIAPHVRSAEDAQRLVAACRYRRGTRGFSTSPRAGGYGRAGLQTHVEQSDAAVSIVAQIEDADALRQLDAILDAQIDACFIGRADLAVSSGVSQLRAPVVERAVDAICAAARARKLPIAVFLADASEREAFSAKGASVFVIGSDLGWMRASAAACAAAFRAGLPSTSLSGDSR